jgi:hypothetical protein
LDRKYFMCFIINIDIRVSLYVSRLILWA